MKGRNYDRRSIGLLLFSAVILAGACSRGPAAAQAGNAPLHRASISYSCDGLKLTGLLSKPTGEGPFPVVIVNHGGFDPASRVGGFLDLFSSRGYVALAPDYRGCGGSEGKHELAKGEVADVIGAIRYARTLPYADGNRVVLWGFSHGAALALLAASRDQSIRAVVAVQGPVEMADAWRHWVRNQDKPGVKPLAGLSTLVGGTPDQIPEAWRERSALYVADKIKCPVLLVYSDDDRDDAVPTDQGRRMEAALRASGNAQAELVLVAGANHGLDAKSWAALMPRILEFIQHRTHP